MFWNKGIKTIQLTGANNGAKVYVNPYYIQFVEPVIEGDDRGFTVLMLHHVTILVTESYDEVMKLLENFRG